MQLPPSRSSPTCGSSALHHWWIVRKVEPMGGFKLQWPRNLICVNDVVLVDSLSSLVTLLARHAFAPWVCMCVRLRGCACVCLRGCARSTDQLRMHTICCPGVEAHHSWAADCGFNGAACDVSPPRCFLSQFTFLWWKKKKKVQYNTLFFIYFFIHHLSHQRSHIAGYFRNAPFSAQYQVGAETAREVLASGALRR